MIYQKFSKRQLLAMLWWQQPRFQTRDAIICDGSIRSGKTLCMAVGFILWSMSEFKGQNFAFCGKTIQSLRRNVILNLWDWAPEDFKIVESRTENKLTISDKRGRENTYYLFGGRDESSYTLIQGITLAGVLLDETALQPKSFVEQALGRCSVSGSKFWFNCNPAGPSHWFYKEWIEGDKPKEKNALHVHFTMDDNPSLPPEIRARYEGMFSGVFYDRYIQGLWVIAEGIIYRNFDKGKHTTGKTPWLDINGTTRPGTQYYISIDYGILNPFSAGLWAVYKGVAYRWREYYYKGRDGGHQRTDEEHYKAVERLAGDLPIELIVIDPSASSFKTTINRHGRYSVVNADNDVLPGISTVTSLLAAGRLKIGTECKDCISEFGLYAWDADGDDGLKEEVVKENDHCLTGDTLVDTVCGPVRIDELVGKCGCVYCTDGERREIGVFHDVRMTQKEAEVFEVTLADGRSVKATADHPILTRRGWVQIKDLRTDDEIACIGGMYDESDLQRRQENGVF